jgi:cytochrome d ubiquinol oxidase subunit I
MVLAAFITTCFVIGGVSASYLIRNRHVESATVMLKLAVAFAAIAVPLQIIAGDMHGLAVHEHQPAKLAAIEGHWETHRGAPLVLFAVPDSEKESNDYEVSVPKLGSVIITHTLDGEIRGLKSFPKEDRPPVAPVFYAFRVMVAIGFLMLALVVWSAVRWRAGDLASSRAMLRAWKLMTPMGFVAVLAGWYVTEIGRQPFVIYGLMRTAEAGSAVSAGSVITSLVAFGTVYLFVFAAGTWYLLRLLRKGPQPVLDSAMLHPEHARSGDKTPQRPLSVPDDSIEGR